MSAKSVTVYQFEYLEPKSRMWLKSPVPATMKEIIANAWRAIPGTGKQVAPSLVASNGVAYAPGEAMKALLKGP